MVPVPHRRMGFTVPKRLRPYCLWRRQLLGDLARGAARTATTFVRATLDEPELSVGLVLSLQSLRLACPRFRTTPSVRPWLPAAMGRPPGQEAASQARGAA